MFRLLISLAFVGLAFAGTLPDDLDGRIVNGVDTTIEQHPHQVSLQRTKGSHFCGGALLNSDTVVTAAHCVSGSVATGIQVRVGSTLHNSGGDIISVRALAAHPGYNSQQMVNDVAVLKLATPVEKSSKVGFIELADAEPETGAPANVTGWGTKCYLICPSLPTTLQEVELTLLTKDECASDKFKYGDAIKESMLCGMAPGKDACQGDSGGPMVSGGKLVGVVSWGNGCAKDGYPGVFAEISTQRDWILDVASSL